MNGIVGGEPLLQKTVLPVAAEANVSIRLAPGQDVEEIAAAFERIVRDAAPAGAELEIERWSSAPAGLDPAGRPAGRLAQDAFERVLGRRPLLLRSGGTLPIVPALADKGIPTILSGFALPGANVHSPNERLLVRYIPLGVEAARETLVAFARARLGADGLGCGRARRVVVLGDEPVVAEAAHRLDDREERLALRGQLVLDARAATPRSSRARGCPPARARGAARRASAG